MKVGCLERELVTSAGTGKRKMENYRNRATVRQTGDQIPTFL